MMSGEIKQVFDEQTKHLSINRDFANEVIDFERRFVYGREENLNFLGGALIGTPRFRFYDSDRSSFFDDLTGIDDHSLRRQVHGLRVVNSDFKVQSDIFNQTCLYLVHRMKKQILGRELGEQAQLAAMRLLHYRLLSSLLYHYFPYGSDPKIAEATYSQLNYRFSLKQQGSWAKLIDARSNYYLWGDYGRREAIHEFSPDEQLLTAISQIQGGIRSIVKTMTSTYYEIRERNEYYRSDSAKGVDLNQEYYIRDLVRQESAYKDRLHKRMNTRQDWIRTPFVDVVTEMVQTVQENPFRESLAFMVDNKEEGRVGERIRYLADGVVEHAISYIRDNRKDFRRQLDLRLLLPRLKSLYTASKSRDDRLNELKGIAYEIAEQATSSRNQTLLSAIRTSIMLYIVLAAFADPVSEGTNSSTEDFSELDVGLVG